MKPIGKNQTVLLESLRRHGYWYPGCGWLWNTRGETIRMMDGLVKHGLATKRRLIHLGKDTGRNEYRPVGVSNGTTSAL